MPRILEEFWFIAIQEGNIESFSCEVLTAELSYKINSTVF